MRALRALSRAVPVVLLAAAAGAYLRRRAAPHPALPPGRAGSVPPPERAAAAPEPSHVPAGEPPRGPIDIVAVVDDLLGARG